MKNQKFQFTQSSHIQLYFDCFYYHSERSVPIEFVATSRLPTAFGDFNISVFQDPATGEEHVALSKGLETAPNQPVLVRIHSECLTGDAFASLKCDCGPQLQATQRMINEAGQGVILYLRQEGRGVGLAKKILAYDLQDQGNKKVVANLFLNCLPMPAVTRCAALCWIICKSKK